MLGLLRILLCTPSTTSNIFRWWVLQLLYRVLTIFDSRYPGYSEIPTIEESVYSQVLGVLGILLSTRRTASSIWGVDYPEHPGVLIATNPEGPWSICSVLPYHNGRWNVRSSDSKISVMACYVRRMEGSAQEYLTLDE